MASQGGPSIEIQQAVDQAIGFNLYAVPELVSSSAGGDKAIREIVAVERLHRFQVSLEQPNSKVQACNIFGEQVGRLDVRLVIIDDDFLARPDRRPIAIPLNPNLSQRFVIQQMTIGFGDGVDRFNCFGTGRTFPMTVGGQPRLVFEQYLRLAARPAPLLRLRDGRDQIGATPRLIRCRFVSPLNSAFGSKISSRW